MTYLKTNLRNKFINAFEIEKKMSSKCSNFNKLSLKYNPLKKSSEDELSMHSVL